MTVDIHSKYYVTKSDIKKLLECGYDKSKKIFDAAREAELKSGLILAHDNKVSLKTVSKITGFDINLSLKLKAKQL